MLLFRMKEPSIFSRKIRLPVATENQPPKNSIPPLIHSCLKDFANDLTFKLNSTPPEYYEIKIKVEAQTADHPADQFGSASACYRDHHHLHL